MPSSVTAKTVSVPKRVSLRIGIGLVLIVLALVFSLWVMKPKLNNGSIVQFTNANHTYSLVVAKTTATQEKGLGDRPSLPTNQGMLFVFPPPATVQCFWMQAMHFPLDIIWLNVHKQVVYVQPDVSPATYPNAFCPKVQTGYVIELNAGQAQAAHIWDGETLNF
jgi:uncharacterized protein